MGPMGASAGQPTTYLLTGAASGLGKSLALELSKQPASDRLAQLLAGKRDKRARIFSAQTQPR